MSLVLTKQQNSEENSNFVVEILLLLIRHFGPARQFSKFSSLSATLMSVSHDKWCFSVIVFLWTLIIQLCHVAVYKYAVTTFLGNPSGFWSFQVMWGFNDSFCLISSAIFDYCMLYWINFNGNYTESPHYSHFGSQKTLLAKFPT